MSTPAERTCQRCQGCGRIANTDRGEPWSDWEKAPAPSRFALRLGIVRPHPCPDCQGTGTLPADTEPEAVS